MVLREYQHDKHGMLSFSWGGPVNFFWGGRGHCKLMSAIPTRLVWILRIQRGFSRSSPTAWRTGLPSYSFSSMDKVLRLNQFVDHCVEPTATERIFRIQHTVSPAVAPPLDASSVLFVLVRSHPQRVLDSLICCFTFFSELLTRLR